MPVFHLKQRHTRGERIQNRKNSITVKMVAVPLLHSKSLLTTEPGNILANHVFALMHVQSAGSRQFQLCHAGIFIGYCRKDEGKSTCPFLWNLFPGTGRTLEKD